jgi:uncharacterized protein YhfF
MEWRHLESFSFGDNPALADELLALVLEGKKRATCWAVSEGLKGAGIGKAMVVRDGAGRPRAVLRTVELTQCRYDEVDAAFAFDEGEGDRSLAYWRDAHQRYFTRLKLFDPKMMLWCERFELVAMIPLEAKIAAATCRSHKSNRYRLDKSYELVFGPSGGGCASCSLGGGVLVGSCCMSSHSRDMELSIEE